MAKIILDIPKSKLQTLLNVLIPLGIDTQSILHAGNKKHAHAKQYTLKKRSPRFLLNWEFFSNELEYE